MDKRACDHVFRCKQRVCDHSLQDDDEDEQDEEEAEDGEEQDEYGEDEDEEDKDGEEQYQYGDEDEVDMNRRSTSPNQRPSILYQAQNPNDKGAHDALIAAR